MSFFGRIRKAVRAIVPTRFRRAEPKRASEPPQSPPENIIGEGPTPTDFDGFNPTNPRAGDGVDGENGAWYRVVTWGDYGDWQSVRKGDTPTEGQIKGADIITIAYWYPGTDMPVYRSFRGPTEDLQRTIDYWKSIGSL